MRKYIASFMVALIALVTNMEMADAHRRHRRRSHSTKYVRHHENIFDDLAHCEGGHNPRIVSRNGKYFGTVQFLPSTWRSLPGHTGMPHHHTYEQQLRAAEMLVARSGWRQFPACSRAIGAR